MLVLDVVRVVLALTLLVALPGWLVVQALWPERGGLRASERLYLSIAGGVLMTMLVASVLGFLPHGDRGALQSVFLGGMPNLEIAMLAVCVCLFWLGVHRGAYPVLAARYPRFASPWSKMGH